METKETGEMNNNEIADKIELDVNDNGSEVFIAFLLDEEKIGYLDADILKVWHLEEIYEESIESGYDNDLSYMFDESDKVVHLGYFKIEPKWRHMHLAKPCFKKALDWLERNKPNCRAFVGRALSQDAKGLDQSNLLGFYESVGFDVVGDYGDSDGALIVREFR